MHYLIVIGSNNSNHNKSLVFRTKKDALKYLDSLGKDDKDKWDVAYCFYDGQLIFKRTHDRRQNYDKQQ